MINKVNEDTKNQLVTFIGTTPNIGTTLIAFTVAVKLAERKNKKVAYICYNLKSSKLHRYLGIGEQRASLDELLPLLRNGSFNQEVLQHAMHRYDSTLELYVLFGNRYRETAEYYGVEELTELIHTACKKYDYVLLDVNAYWDNAATISALAESERLVVTTTNALSHFQDDYLSWIGAMGEHLQLDRKLIYNCVIKQPRGLYQPRHCFSGLIGQELPPVTIPSSLYEALDRGELNIWLKQKEGQKWLSSFAEELFPQMAAAKFPRSGISWLRPLSAVTALMMYKQK